MQINKRFNMSKFIIVLFLLSVSFGYSQNIVGKIYTKTEANSLFGPVVTGIPISSSQLQSYTLSTNNYIMFRIDNGNLTILDSKRIPLFPVSATINSQDIYRYFSISLVQKLINDGKNTSTYVELRSNGTLTITNGDYTLDYSNSCPPNCPI